MNAQEIDYDQLAKKIAVEMAKAPPKDKVIWNTVDCANYFDCTRKHFTDNISKKPSFPHPIANLSFKWFMKDVIKWAEKKSAK